MHVFATFTKFNHGVIHSICTIAIHVSRPWTQICPGEIVDTVLPNSSRHDIVPINSAVYAETKTTVYTLPDSSRLLSTKEEQFCVYIWRLCFDIEAEHAIYGQNTV